MSSWVGMAAVRRAGHGGGACEGGGGEEAAALRKGGPGDSVPCMEGSRRALSDCGERTTRAFAARSRPPCACRTFTQLRMGWAGGGLAAGAGAWEERGHGEGALGPVYRHFLLRFFPSAFFFSLGRSFSSGSS